ncbi:MAG: membrane dipeptidase [Gaiellales bacterium]
MIADAHVDLLLELSYRQHTLGEERVFERTWAVELATGGVGLQVCPIWVDIALQPEATLRESLRQVVAFQSAIRESPAQTIQVCTRGDLELVRRGERLGLMLALEGVEQFGVELWPADLFFELGVRVASLTWNRRNAFADGAAEEDGGGLSRLGRSLVDRLVSLGVVLDVAHASRATFVEVLERAAGAPVMCTHGGCRAVNDTPRNLDDDQLRALAAAGGLFGLMLHPLAIDPVTRTVDRVVDHLEHAAETIGIDRLCLGGDFTSRLWKVMPPPPEPADGLMPAGLAPGVGVEGLTSSRDYPNLLAALARRGWSAADIEAVSSANLIRFLSTALPK